ncbi:hypothetical protein Y1Q_0012645 [Alligator mississippiensis]|uniref:Uncharacterized protein n=1 Tax=Alligator mississippiensis TaxID=8496 RepID=A0A151M8D9_ALLMI|nr:hypothetical protein Y1Q_0012645 [Alligator mississippiensis]
MSFVSLACGSGLLKFSSPSGSLSGSCVSRQLFQQNYINVDYWTSSVSDENTLAYKYSTGYSRYICGTTYM